MARFLFTEGVRKLSAGNGSPIPRARPILSVGAIATGLLAVALAGGCVSRVKELRKPADFERLIGRRGQPVVVDFYKAGCEHCSALEVTLNELAGEFAGRAAFAKFLLMRANGQATAPEIVAKHDIPFYPTVIIFVDGQERKRLVQQYRYSDYVAALNECLAAQPAGKADGGAAAPVGSR